MRRYLAILFLGLAVVPFAWTGLAPAKSTAPQSRQVGCGVERWSVKTLADPAGRLLSLQPRAATVRGLRRKQAPAYLSLRRIHGVEHTTYRVQASLVEMKLEDDSDIHLVIADPRSGGQTMIAEFPAATCTGHATLKARTKMRRARSAFVAACGSPTRSFKKLQWHRHDHGRGFLRPDPRPDRRRAERHRAASGRRFQRGDVPRAAGSATAAARRPSAAERQLRGFVSGLLHQASAARPRLRGHPGHQLPRALGRPGSRSAPRRR